MSRYPHFVLAFGLLFVVGCGTSEIDSLRAAVRKHEKAAKAAAAEATLAKAETKQVREEALRKLAYAEHLTREATATAAKAESQIDAANAIERAGQIAKAEGQVARAEAKELEKIAAKAQLAAKELIENSRNLIADADKAKKEAAVAKTVIDEVRRLSDAAREDRAAAEKALAEVTAARQLIASERAAADKEQRAASAAVEAARLEKEAAGDAVEAARLAKQEVLNDRGLLQQERELLATAREEVDHRMALADARLAKVELKKVAADQARAEAARQQVILSEQIASLEAAKEAAAISELSAEQARALASVERKAAERAKASADAARQDASASNDYVSSVLAQLRETQGQGEVETRPRSSVKISAGTTEDATK